MPEVGFEPTHREVKVFETSASAIPPLGPECSLHLVELPSPSTVAIGAAL